MRGLGCSIDESYFAAFRMIRSLISFIEARYDLDAIASDKEAAVTRWLKNAHYSEKKSLANLRANKKQLIAALMGGYTTDGDPRERPYVVAREYFRLTGQSPRSTVY